MVQSFTGAICIKRDTDAGAAAAADDDDDDDDDDVSLSRNQFQVLLQHDG